MSQEEEDEELVCEYFQIDELELEERAQINDYWESAYDYYMKVKDRPLSSISRKMTDWLTKIEFDLNERK